MVLGQLGGQISGVKAMFVYCWWEKQKSSVSDGSSLPSRTVALQPCKRMNRRSSRGLWHTHHFHRALTHVYISRDRQRRTFLHMNSRLNRAGVQNEVFSSPHWAPWWGNFCYFLSLEKPISLAVCWDWEENTGAKRFTKLGFIPPLWFCSGCLSNAWNLKPFCNRRGSFCTWFDNFFIPDHLYAKPELSLQLQYLLKHAPHQICNRRETQTLLQRINCCVLL